jgi:hypothetical protein
VTEVIAKEIAGATQSDGGKFAESLKEDNSAGKAFAESLKGDSSARKDFAESLKENREGKEQETRPLTDEDRERIKQETGWPGEIVDNIKTKEEYEIYKNAGLEEQKINDKPCLVRTDIDIDQKDEFGRTNRERMAQGLSPIARNGERVELHHIGQKPDSPLAELTKTEHRGKGNDVILHDKTQGAQILRDEFRPEREAHWETRAKQG